MNNPVTPICLAPQGDVAPHSYVIQLEATRCTNCNKRKTHCHVYSKTHLKSRMGGKFVTNLRPVRGPKDIQWNVPIEPAIVPDVIIPFCEDCFDRVELNHLPSPPVVQSATILNSHTDDTKAAKGGARKDARDAKPKKTPTIDDLSF
jgi:hypothetical protein